jgi:hypothetical protein
MCIPQACKVSDLNAFKPYIVTSINSMLPFLFEDVKGLGLEELQLTSGNITFEMST